MTEKNKHIIIIAGEASGDMHAAELVKEIKKLDPSVHFSGLGGAKMHNAGVEIYQDLTKIAVVGFFEVLRHYGLFKKTFDLILKKITETKADAVILVDYPGFNLRLAKKIKKGTTRVIYYISPQVWAWKQDRIKIIKKHVDNMLVLFKFEEEFYLKKGYKADFIGHPLVDAVKISKSREEFLSELGLIDYKLTVGILPGSRQKEIEKLLPIMLKASIKLYRDFPMLQFVIIKAPTISRELILSYIPNIKIPLCIVEDKQYDGINACDICMVASGTATLETAILLKPMVIVYKTSLLTWLLAKLFIRIPNIGLVNVVAGKRIVPECIQFKAKPNIIAEEIKNIFTDEIRISGIREDLKEVKLSLGEEGASNRAAEEIITAIKS